MKNLILILAVFSISIGYTQISLPINFESDTVTTADFVDFDGGTGSVVLNPSIGGMNTSDSVGQIIRNGGQVWAGSKIAMANNLDFSTFGAIRMKVYTTAPVGTVVKFKLEGSGAPVEVDVNTTVSGGWDTLTWNFTGTPNNLNTLVFMFDFGNTGNGSANSTFYFDDIKQVMAPAAATLPIDFETAVNVMAFDNAIGAQVANPSVSGINTSATVGQLTRPTGTAGVDEYAGSRIILANNIDFTTQTALRMKVYCTEPVGHLIKVKFEGGTPIEVDAYTTVSGAWETIEWDFTGLNGGTNNQMLFMFNAGTLGAGEVYYFDDIEQVVATQPVLDSLPIDFETNVNIGAFDNAIAAQVANPFQTGINTSDSVGQLTRPSGGTGNEYAGSRIRLTPDIDFSTLPILAMKVYCTEPVGHLIKVKFEGGTPIEVDANTTVSGDWETLYWDFTGLNGGTNNEMLFMFNAGVLGTGEVYYFDDIEQLATIPVSNPDLISLPIDFETDVVTDDFVDFNGAVASVVTNTHPTGINTSSKVGQIVRNGGDVWAGSSLALDGPLDFTTLHSISIKVFTNAPIGTTMKLKLENDNNDVEVDVVTTVSGDWENLIWDFSGQPTEFDKISFMFDHGNVGDGSISSTFLFDDVQQTDQTNNIGAVNNLGIKVYPNPAENAWFFTSENENIASILIYDGIGSKMVESIVNKTSHGIDASGFAPGIYSAKISTSTGFEVIKIIKK